MSRRPHGAPAAACERVATKADLDTAATTLRSELRAVTLRVSALQWVVGIQSAISLATFDIVAAKLLRPSPGRGHAAPASPENTMNDLATCGMTSVKAGGGLSRLAARVAGSFSMRSARLSLPPPPPPASVRKS